VHRVDPLRCDLIDAAKLSDLFRPVKAAGCEPGSADDDDLHAA